MPVYYAARTSQKLKSNIQTTQHQPDSKYQSPQIQANREDRQTGSQENRVPVTRIAGNQDENSSRISDPSTPLRACPEPVEWDKHRTPIEGIGTGKEYPMSKCNLVT